MSSIAIVGPGAVGCAVGGALVEVGHDVTFCARHSFSQLSVRKAGDPPTRFTARVVTDPAAATQVDWLLLCVKTYQVAAAAPWFEAAVGPRTRVAVRQNGLFDGSFVTATTSEDFRTIAWRKLCLNAPDGAILALTGQPRRVWHAPGMADVGRAILRECVASRRPTRSSGCSRRSANVTLYNHRGPQDAPHCSGSSRPV